MKHLLTALCFLLSLNTIAQVIEPVEWSFDSKQLENGFYQLFFNANIDDGWYVYSQDIGEGGPVPTSFNFDESKDFELKGKIKEKGKLIAKFDKMFDMDIKKYPGKLSFVATVKPLKDNGKVTGFLEFMTCDDMRCLPPEQVDFDFTLGAMTKASAKPKVKTGGIKPEKSAANSGTSSNSGNPTNTNVQSQTTNQGNQSGGILNRGKQIGGQAAGAVGQAANNAANQVNETANNILNRGKNTSTGIYEPVSWKFEQESLGNNEALLHFYATIDNGWYVYSQNVADGGPQPTAFTFENKDGIELIGKVKEEGKLIEKFDKMFDMTVRKYAKKIHFTQKAKITKPQATTSGYLTFMTCDDSKCLPPEDVDFAFSLTQNSKASEAVAAGGSGSTSGNTGSGGNTALGAGETALGVAAGGATNATTNTNEGTTSGAGSSANGGSMTAGPDMFSSVIKDCGVDTDVKEEKSKTPWMIFLLGFLGGFAALLTPCVFPMIPLTVSFFTKQSKTKRKGIINAIIYAVSIIVIYVGLGFFVTKAFGPDFLNVLSTNEWFNLAFFVIFVIFAFSFFGFFEITLPNSIINRSDAAADKGGLIGIFFMAFTLALVSFSCTGPIIGTLLVQAAVGGQTLGPMVGMFGFALALSLPFALFAAFPGWLNSLPKSGGWLDTVKKVLGFIELIFALKFLSNADMVRQWGILPREVFIGIWVILLVALGLYLIGKIKLPHDSPIKKLSATRIGLSAFSIIFALLLVPGVFLKKMPVVGEVISGFPPPFFYNIPNLWGSGDGHADAGDSGHDEGGIHGIKDLEAGLAEARKSGKPILLDFTGWACVNCRKMEENVWPKMEQLMEEYTLISLYVDENISLPKEEQFAYKLGEKKKRVRTVGNKWSYLETKCFNTNTQPFYVLLNHDGEHLVPPKGYTPDMKEYSDFLETGLKNFKKGKSLLSSN